MPQWDPELGTAMQQVGRCVHEERVLEELLTDLNDFEPNQHQLGT